MEWQYTLRVLPDVASNFERLEAALDEDFLAPLLQESGSLPEDLRSQLAQPVRFSGLGVYNPSESADEFFQTSKAVTEPIYSSLIERKELDTSRYAAHAASTTEAFRSARTKALQLEFTRRYNEVGELNQRRLSRMAGNGAFLTVNPSYFNGSELSKEEFQDNLRIRYGKVPLSLPSTCDGCSQPFSVAHAMQCKKGGLVTVRHDEVCYEIESLMSQALSPSAVASEPYIYTGRAQQTALRDELDDDGTPSDRPDDRGDILCHGFWRRGRTTIFDVRVTDTDAKSYQRTDPSKVLANQEQAKKRKYLKPCEDRRRSFTPLVFSVDGMKGTETKAAFKQLASRLAAKWGRSYPQMCQFVNSRVSVTLARSTTMLLRGPRSDANRHRNYNWGNGDAGVNLYLRG